MDCYQDNWYQGKINRSMEQNKVQKIDSHLNGQLIFNKGAKAFQRIKRVFFQQMVLKQFDDHV